MHSSLQRYHRLYTRSFCRPSNIFLSDSFFILICINRVSFCFKDSFYLKSTDSIKVNGNTRNSSKQRYKIESILRNIERGLWVTKLYSCLNYHFFLYYLFINSIYKFVKKINVFLNDWMKFSFGIHHNLCVFFLFFLAFCIYNSIHFGIRRGLRRYEVTVSIIVNGSVQI